MATLNTAQLAGAPYQIPPEPSRLPSILMAMLVHGVLIGFLWFGINWQNTEPTAVEAEVWDMETMQAAPPLQAQPEPEPEPEPLPRPEPTPPPAPAPAPKVIEPPAPPKVVEPPAVKKTPDIALERQKEQKKKLLEKKLAEEKLLAEKKKELAELKKKEIAEKEKDLAELKEKQLDDKKARDLAAKKEKDKADKLAKAAKAAQELAETKRLDKLRDAEMARIANAAGSAGSTGSAAKSTSPNLDNSYKAAINAKIKGNTSFGGSGAIVGNPYVSFSIQQLPTGEIISVRKVKSSGVDAFDDAVERGINNSSPLPKRKDGTVERTLTVGYRLNDID